MKKHHPHLVFLQLFSLSLIIFTFSSCTNNSEKNITSDQRPNIVFIIGDDVGCYDLSCYGNEKIKTPNIDELAAMGMKFNNTFLTTSSCSPSRVSIITGRYPHNTGACELHSPLPANQILFPEILKKNGYYTAQAGKWHFGSTPMIHSEKDTVKLGPAVRAFDRISAIKEVNGDGGENMWIPFLKERPREKPFFMWFAAYDSHRPWGADDFKIQNRAEDVWVPEFLYNGELTRKDLVSYYNEISRLDYYIGKVEEELERQGVADNTIIVFTSDNGRPFPRSKTRVYDSGMKTPLIIKWPAKIKPGQETGALVSIIDVAPTLLNAAGIKPGKTFQGRSFTKLFDNPSQEFRNYTFSEHNWHDYEAYERQVHTKQWLYLINKRPQFDAWGPADAVVSPSMHELYEAYKNNELKNEQKDIFIKPRPEEELFNCKEDPFQFHNLALNPEYKSIKDSLSHILALWQAETGDTCPDSLTADHFDRITGKRLFEGFKWGEMPGAALRADTITAPGPF
ncbi:MAG: sulfatase [Chlorobi bacterium]|nr:sulfatase [Chlorobiota bacterium]